MKLLSVNVGMPRSVGWQGDTVTTGIFKQSLSGPARVRTLNIDGDRQADLTVHGGALKAVYAYPHEHYDFWRGELPEHTFDFGAFGENLSTVGLLERDVSPGDLLEIGTAAFRVTVPRMPCYKLGIRFGRLDMVKRFWRSRRCGFYLSVTREGTITAGDAIRLTKSPEGPGSIADAFQRRSKEG